jgi:hypothetical protein
LADGVDDFEGLSGLISLLSFLCCKVAVLVHPVADLLLQMFADIRKFTELIEPNSTATLSPGKGVDMQAQDP